MLELIVFVVAFVIGAVVVFLGSLTERANRGITYWRTAGEYRLQGDLEHHERELGLTRTGDGGGMAAVLRESPMGPYDFRIEDVDWVVALGLNTTHWRIIDPDGGSASVTDDIGIAIDNLDWGCKVVSVGRKDV